MANGEDALRLLGLARKAGRLEIGEEPVGAAARAGKARLILAAADAADNTLRRAYHFTQEGNAPLMEVPWTKGELGLAAGRSSCALLAFTDAGLAASFAAKLSALDPERYGEAAERLSAKAQRILQRQKEKRRQEKALQKEAQRPWCAPSSGAERRLAEKKGRKTGGKPGASASRKPRQKAGKRGGGRQVT